MKTLAFHSYKGGTGRTMAVANCALGLAQAGKKVILVDLDFESPGLPFRFGVETQVRGGYVHYLASVTPEQRLDDRMRTMRQEYLKSSCIRLHKFSDNLTLLPSGDVFSRDYHSIMSSQIFQSNLRFSESQVTSDDAPLGSSGQINWKAFEQDLEDMREALDDPDYCIVDCKAAHETASIALLGWADHIIEFFHCNREGVFGALLLESLLRSQRFGKLETQLTTVVSRVPSDVSDLRVDRELESIASSYDGRFATDNSGIFRDTQIIREQRSIELGNDIVLKMEDRSAYSLSYDYARLLTKITGVESLEQTHWEHVLDLDQGDELFEKAFVYLRQVGELRNRDNAPNVALRRETLGKMIEAIAEQQVAAFRLQRIKESKIFKTVAAGFRSAGVKAGTAFGAEAQDPGRVWPVGDVPSTVQARLNDWCEFDRESGFGDWVAEYSEDEKAGFVDVGNDFLGGTKFGRYFIMGYIEGVLMYLIQHDFKEESDHWGIIDVQMGEIGFAENRLRFPFSHF